MIRAIRKTTLLTACGLIWLLSLASCDVQSGITKKSVEKYGPTPTPSISPTPELPPIDPADVVQVNTSVQGPTISVNDRSEKNRITCDKYNRIMVNSDGAMITIKGACSKVLINGDRNQVTAEAAAEIVFNGSGNTLRYSRYANGKRPLVTDNRGDNVTETISATVKN